MGATEAEEWFDPNHVSALMGSPRLFRSLLHGRI